MKYQIPTLQTPIDTILYDWVDTIPEHLRQKAGLMDLLLRICGRIYNTDDGISRNSNINPFYKIIELLSAEKLEYWHLQKIKEYYHFDIIRYLTKDNIAEVYVGYPCYDSKALKSALCQRNNKTNSETLANILANIV